MEARGKGRQQEAGSSREAKQERQGKPRNEAKKAKPRRQQKRRTEQEEGHPEAHWSEDTIKAPSRVFHLRCYRSLCAFQILLSPRLCLPT